MKTPKRVRLAAIILFMQAIFLTIVLAAGVYAWWLVSQAERQIVAVVDEGMRQVESGLADAGMEEAMIFMPATTDLPLFGPILTQLFGVKQFLLPALLGMGILVAVAYVTSVGVWRRQRWAFLAVIGIAVVYFLFIIPPVGAFFMLFFTVPLLTPKSIKAFWGEGGLNKKALLEVGESARQRGEQLRDQVSENETLKQVGSSVRTQSEQLRDRVQASDSFQQLKSSTRGYADKVGQRLINDDLQSEASADMPADIETPVPRSELAIEDSADMDTTESVSPPTSADMPQAEQPTNSPATPPSSPTDHSGYLS